MKRFSLPWSLLRLAGVVGVMLAIALFMQSAATVDADEYPTKAKVSSEGVPPVIECKWELPDMANGDLAGRDPYPDITFEYGTAANIHEHDDSPLGPTPLNPCSLPAAPGTPTMANGATGMMTITANPGDLPELRRFQVWMAVDHPNGIGAISDVYWDIFHPDGTPKTQVHGIKVPLADCASLGSSTAAGTMFEAAVHTGQLSAAAVDDINRGMVAKCHEQEKAIYYAEWTVSKEQPCGSYQVVAHAVSNATQAPTLTNYFNVVCFFSGQIDFAALDWGTISPGITDVVSGDLIWDIPPDNAPTVRNVGNIGLEPAVRFQQMCSTTLPIPKCIDQFDVAFGRSPAVLQYIDPVFANTWVDFDDTRERVLCADELGKMDFSIHPPSTLPADAYEGTIDIIFQAVRGVCRTDQELITPPPPPGP
jgi:hypothetical protein